MPNQVYFLRNTRTGEIKIGQTRRLHKRKAVLEREEGCKLELLGLIEAPLLERDLHQRFAQFHTRGEWFKPHPELLAYIRAYSSSVPTQPDTERVIHWPGAVVLTLLVIGFIIIPDVLSGLTLARELQTGTLSMEVLIGLIVLLIVCNISIAGMPFLGVRGTSHSSQD
jgi:hypothetical protein